jgi:hypothetical protein
MLLNQKQTDLYRKKINNMKLVGFFYFSSKKKDSNNIIKEVGAHLLRFIIEKIKMEFLQMNKCNTMDLSYIYFY